MSSTPDEIREQALANFDALLHHWNLDYRKITEYEYDIIATWREDKNFGGVRFNLKKARGADFAGGGLTKDDFDILSLQMPAFDKEDYAGYTPTGQGKAGFDIIGLAQRVYQCPSYADTVGRLSSDLTTIGQFKALSTPSSNAAMRRESDYQERVKKSKRLALDMWESCKFFPFEGSIGDKYLLNRHKLTIRDENMRYHPGILCRVINKWEKFPALIFKVQENLFGPLKAIHRVYLSEDGHKASIPNPKMALAPIKGMGIWFGQRSHILRLTEGPENALALRQLGCPFVCSSVFGTNLHNISIPHYVKKLVIYPDPDEAGMRSFNACIDAYGKLPIEVKAVFTENDKLDLNDHLKEENN